MLAKVPPLLNPATKAALELAASANILPEPATCWGEMLLNRRINGFSNGILLDRLSAICPGKVSINMPTPPRSTVFFNPKGVQENPKRGCHEIFVKDGIAWASPTLITWL